jgi:hypothetical protein
VNENNAFFVSKNIGQISELIKLESRPEQVNFQIKNLLKSNGFSFVSNHIFLPCTYDIFGNVYIHI